MDRQYPALPIRELGDGAGFRRPTQLHASRVDLESPAIGAMTDLARASPATIRPQAPIGGANQFMIARGVRLLLVVDDRENMLGVLTATDILGERGMQVAIERRTKRDELNVADLMTPASAVEVLALSDVEGARVGHVLETLRRSGRQHALVVDQEVIPARGALDKPLRRAMVRGIFSLSQIARQLGVAVQTGGEVARTFSEIESALGR
ncbi:MAG TPA: CBS domain-containing protein [Burkholderiales bacterium]|nr:CBS domain-containing protein [Burkholderiales bacterium]